MLVDFIPVKQTILFGILVCSEIVNVNYFPVTVEITPTITVTIKLNHIIKKASIVLTRALFIAIY